MSSCKILWNAVWAISQMFLLVDTSGFSSSSCSISLMLFSVLATHHRPDGPLLRFRPHVVPSLWYFHTFFHIVDLAGTSWLGKCCPNAWHLVAGFQSKFTLWQVILPLCSVVSCMVIQSSDGPKAILPLKERALKNFFPVLVSHSWYLSPLTLPLTKVHLA